MSEEKQKTPWDVIVIGGGPGGYVCAIRCAQLGFKTALIEKQYLGGVCLNVGCVPSKALISATHFLHKVQNHSQDMGFLINSVQVDVQQLQKWKQSISNKMSAGVGQLLKGNGVTVFMGQATFVSPNEIQVNSSSGDTNNPNGNTVLSAKHFVIATGSIPIEIPGFPVDEQTILSSTGALALDHIPKRLVIIGGGYIGLEMAGIYSKLGSQVTILEAQSQILAGVVDPECAQVVERKLKKAKVKILLNTKALSQKVTGNDLLIQTDTNGELVCDKLILTVGRRPQPHSCNPNKAGVQINEKGFVSVNLQRQTVVPHIFAIGDIVQGPMLAHKASYEGILVAEVLAGHARAYDVKTVPAVVFTDPEIASAGMTEAEARNQGFVDLKIAKFPFAANARATSMMETDGFVKIIADAKTHAVLGIHIVGPEASNLISEGALAIEMGARLEDIAGTIHPHPTLGETLMEAAETTLGHPIHVLLPKK